MERYDKINDLINTINYHVSGKWNEIVRNNLRTLIKHSMKKNEKQDLKEAKIYEEAFMMGLKKGVVSSSACQTLCNQMYKICEYDEKVEIYSSKRKGIRVTYTVSNIIIVTN